MGPPPPAPHFHDQVLEIRRRHARDATGLSQGLRADPVQLFPRLVGERHEIHVRKVLGQTELGQGTHTGIAMILADELGADWKRVQVKQALAGEPFKDPMWKMQFTGGSTSLRHRWDLFRNVAASAREMLIQVAAQEWGAKSVDCKAENSRILHSDGRSLSFGRLCQKAAALPVPQKPPLKDPKDYRIIGSKKARLDLPDKVAGLTKFGIDFKVMTQVCTRVRATEPVGT